MKPRFFLRVLALLPVTIQGCGSSTPHENRAVRTAFSRLYVTKNVDTVFIARLTRPSGPSRAVPLIAANDSSIVTFDNASGEIEAFDPHARVKWRFGAPPGTRGSFANPLDMDLDASGNLWLVDAGNRTLTQVSATGKLILQIRLPQWRLRDAIPLQNHVLVLPVSTREFALVLDSTGNPTAYLRHPDQAVSAVDPFLRQTFASRARNNDTWATVYPYSNRFDVFDDTKARCTGRLIEGQDFPATRDRAVPWVAAAAASDSVLYVLPRSHSPANLAVLDVYSLNDCRYHYSLRLPRKVSAIAASGSLIYVEHMKPVPEIIGLRFTR